MRTLIVVLLCIAFPAFAAEVPAYTTPPRLRADAPRHVALAWNECQKAKAAELRRLTQGINDLRQQLRVSRRDRDVQKTQMLDAQIEDAQTELSKLKDPTYIVWPELQQFREPGGIGRPALLRIVKKAAPGEVIVQPFHASTPADSVYSGAAAYSQETGVPMGMVPYNFEVLLLNAQIPDLQPGTPFVPNQAFEVGERREIDGKQLAVLRPFSFDRYLDTTKGPGGPATAPMR